MALDRISNAVVSLLDDQKSDILDKLVGFMKYKFDITEEAAKEATSEFQVQLKSSFQIALLDYKKRC